MKGQREKGETFPSAASDSFPEQVWAQFKPAVGQMMASGQTIAMVPKMGSNGEEKGEERRYGNALKVHGLLIVTIFCMLP